MVVWGWLRRKMKHRETKHEILGLPCPFSPVFWVGGSPTKIDHRKKGTLMTLSGCKDDEITFLVGLLGAKPMIFIMPPVKPKTDASLVTERTWRLCQAKAGCPFVPASGCLALTREMDRIHFRDSFGMRHRALRVTPN